MGRYVALMRAIAHTPLAPFCAGLDAGRRIDPERALGTGTVTSSVFVGRLADLAAE